MINIDGANFPMYSKYEFDLLRPPSRPRLSLHHGTADDLKEGASLAARNIPGDLAGLDAVRKVKSRNPNNVLLIKKDEKVVGVWSMLMLNPRGVEALLLGELQATDPSCEYLSAAAESPAAIYFWAIVAPGFASEGVRHIAQFLRQPLYGVSNLFSRPTTDDGVRFHNGMGFRPLGASHPGLYRYVRLANRSVLAGQQAAKRK